MVLFILRQQLNWTSSRTYNCTLLIYQINLLIILKDCLISFKKSNKNTLNKFHRLALLFSSFSWKKQIHKYSNCL